MRYLSISKRPPASLLDALFWLLASLPMLLATSLLAVLLALKPAFAADDPACGGHDLLAELKVKDPAAWAAFMARAGTIENGESIFWKIEKEGRPASWLLGTYHVTDPRVTVMPEPARQPFEQSRTLIVESDEILDQKAAAARLMTMPDLMMFSGRETLKDHLTDDEEALLEAGMIKRGIPLMSVIKMKPWLVSSMMSLSRCELARKAAGQPFLDMKLALDARAAGKEIKGLETLAEQLQAMADLPIEFHVKALVSVVRYQDFTVDMMETVTNLYLSGHASLIIPASLEFSPDKSDSDAAEMAQFEQRLIIDRNRVMAARAAPILAEGNVFMAVGAAHLYGPDGVVALLARQGFVMSPVK